MTVHSNIGASSMHRWAHCPGSVRLSKDMPNSSSAYADEGTTAHDLAAQWLTTGTKPKFEDQETEDAVGLYVNTVLEDAGPNKILVEHGFDLAEIYPGLFGTADAVVYDPVSQLLRVFDYKHGKGIYVAVQRNVQLMYYGLGALLSTGYPCREVELVIVQPRLTHVDGPVRRWRTSIIDFVEYAADLADLAKATDDPNAPLVAGDHCRFCLARGVCPELAKKALATAQNEFSPNLSYDPKTLSETLANLPVLDAYIKAVREFAYNEAMHGRCPPGWKLVEKRATRQWRDIAAAEAKMVALVGDDAYDKSLKSVAQCEKTLGKKEFQNMLGGLVVSVSSGVTLAPESDERAPARADASSEFTALGG